mmetsp:Transcript_96425/g.251329  ORF Transcript_96425/g.251329 Transcript_96425/m.251329 type:complete len:93 (-) Transcript_96425:368-646(-)
MNNAKRNCLKSKPHAAASTIHVWQAAVTAESRSGEEQASRLNTEEQYARLHSVDSPSRATLTLALDVRLVSSIICETAANVSQVLRQLRELL